MTSSVLTYRLLQFLILSAIIGLLGGGVYWYFFRSPEINFETLELETEFSRYQKTAEIYRDLRGTYDGACQDLLLPDSMSCDDNDDEFALETRLPDRSYICADSSGYLDIRLYSKLSKTRCD